MRTTSCFILVGLVLLLIFPAGGMAGESAKEAVAAAAAKGLPTMLQQVPLEEVKNYGFRNARELSQARIGTPVEIFTVKPDALMSYSGTGFGLLLQTTDEWYVPVLVGTESRALLTVTRTGDKWEVVGISAAELARELDGFNQRLPAMLSTAGAQQKEQPKFVRIFQAFSDFMYVPTVREEYLVPFSSARAALALAPDKLLAPGAVIPLLRVEVNPS